MPLIARRWVSAERAAGHCTRSPGPTGEQYATGTSLQRLAEQSWDRHAAQTELYYEGERWSGAELAARVRRVTGGLRAAGLRPGERVVVCMANCPEVSITYHAV
jgi:long-chain acyl-CoA synthetase